MDIEFDLEHHATVPKFNQDILDGIAYKQMRDPKGLIDTRIRMAEASFPEGVEFIESTMCTPQEAYRVMTDLTSKIDRARIIDMAKNDVFMVKYQFRALNTDLIPRYMFLPNFKKGSRIRIGGKPFSAIAVLTDPGFSVTGEYIFLRMMRAPVTFKRSIHSAIKDGKTHSRYFAHSKLHWKGGENDRGRESDSIKVGDVYTTLSHYLFCKYGLIGAFERFTRTTPLIMRQEEVTPELIETHHVYRSRKVAPRAWKLRIDYSLIASDLCLLIPKQDTSELLEDMIMAFFYIIDHFPDVEDHHELYGDWAWKVYLGYVLWGDQLGQGKLVENVETHLRSLDGQMDVQTRQTLLLEENLDIENIYSLFAYVCENINDIILNNEGRVASMFGKRLASSQYILKDITEKIFKCMFELTNPRKKEYTVSDYNQIFGKFFTVSTIMGLRNTSEKPFMAHITTPGDNYHYRGTSRLVMQSKTGESSPGSSNRITVEDPAHHFHESWVEGGNFGVLPHAFPLAKATINPTANLDESYTFQPKEHMKDVRAYIKDAIRR